MQTAAKLSAYGVALALIAGGAWAVGAAVGPFEGEAGAHTEEAGHGDAHTTEAPSDDLPGGLASSTGGYTFTPAVTTLTPGVTSTFSFRVTGRDGHAVTAYDLKHEKLMHLIVVRRDGSAFQHVHPSLAADGTWSVPLSLPEPGSYRAFADFAPTGDEATTLGVDLAAPGDFRPVTHEPARVSDVEGYQVRLDGELLPGKASKVTLTVTKNGTPVTDLQPYLGAYGHLVALRGGDLAYLHVHPDGTTAAGPSVTFFAEVPSAGTYRLFLDFQHEGKVRTAEFTVPAEGATS
ncbi:hypothetical protein SAMN05421504_111227 [Amycolatopsis xylanica]|uniref:Secreted protein n=1 Tax=Amycolatopsis xylanica TaxID=589385 RepID=A0A1H3RNS5_9PSEU|nr:hypothetical protein [Amycolatopsis xylanica]SDZ27327.1 hypothetical protein SAMN05421504_111227 [Amycolatopsis xylanica]